MTDESQARIKFGDGVDRLHAAAGVDCIKVNAFRLAVEKFVAPAIAAGEKDKVFIPGGSDDLHRHGEFFQRGFVIRFTAVDGHSGNLMGERSGFSVIRVGEKVGDDRFAFGGKCVQ